MSDVLASVVAFRPGAPAVHPADLAAYLAAPAPAAAIVAGVLQECAMDLPADPFEADAVRNALAGAALDGWFGRPCSDPEDYAFALAHASGRAVAVARGRLAAKPETASVSYAEDALHAMIADIVDDGVPDADFTRFSDGAEALVRAREEGGVVLPLASGGFAVVMMCERGTFSGCL